MSLLSFDLEGQKIRIKRNNLITFSAEYYERNLMRKKEPGAILRESGKEK